MKCLDCAEGFHELCEKGGCSNCHPEAKAEAKAGSLVSLLTGENTEEFEGFGEGFKPRDSRRVKNDMTLKDPHSTGRKRAVTLHGKADPDQACEWQGLANCGGGRFPILGCTGGAQENLHHGPDKNTLNNERSNIHKICSQCHNRWHTLNDVDYEWDGHHELHSPRAVTELDIKEDATRWKTLKVEVAGD